MDKCKYDRLIVTNHKRTNPAWRLEMNTVMQWFFWGISIWVLVGVFSTAFISLVEFKVHGKSDPDPKKTITLCLAGFLTFAFIVKTVADGLSRYKSFKS